MSIINIPEVIGVFSGLNECANLFQWVKSAISSLNSQLNETQKDKLQEDVRHLQGDLQCLSDTLPAIYNLIDRAEWRIHDPYVADLLSRLKDAMYDAEDHLDEFRWYETKVSVEGSVISVEPVIDFFHNVTQGSFNNVTDIQKRLTHLSRHLEKMGLLQAVPRFDKSFRPETTSFPTEAKIFGRDKEKKQLIRLLGVPTNNRMDPSRCKRTRSGVPVLPIVGIGGVGKTTLAQDICNHSKVKSHFDLIIWICVSDDFDVKRLTKEIIEQSCGKVPKNDNLNVLQGALANSLNTRRFLLVLDDMWNENEQDWKHLCAPFRNVLQGSMMLVTTRSPKVADVVRTMDPFPLEGLNEDVFREFFKLCVFGSNSSNNDPELAQVGEKILPKLKGSPLAAKTLGRLLGMSLDLAHWDRILKSQLWELRQEDTDILPALRLSYMYLPFYLKRCFSFCAVYPKDYTFKQKELAEIWAAEGLVEHRHTGDQYFEELAHLSFFQKYPRSQEKYVIHDLMHDMAQLVSKDECFILKDSKDLPKIPQNVRHLLVLKGGDVQCSDLLKHDMAQHRKLRTILCDLSLKSKTGNNVMEKWCTELLSMRVMVCSSISKWGLPDSIGNMKLLRYLKILDSSLCKSLPSAFCCLYNMQIFYAMKWEIDDIPSGFVKLINLQKFESKKYQFHHIHSSDIHEGATDNKQRRLFMFRNYNGESPPCGFNAQNMGTITSLVVSSWSGVRSIPFSMNSEQMHSNHSSDHSTFSSLTDVVICSCHNLSSLEHFLQPAYYVPFIKKIDISDCPSLESVPTDRFGDFRLLEILRVSHCPMIKSQRLFAPSLKEMYLEDSGDLGYNIECNSLTILELSDYPLEYIELQLWYLPLLQVLKIRSCPSLTIIRGEGRSRTIDSTFSSLTDIVIQNCQNLSSLEKFIQPAYVPIIKKIDISSCRSLESVPAERFGDLHFLEVLRVCHCPILKAERLFAPSLKKLYLEDSGNLIYNIECSSLTILHLQDHPHKSIELQMWNLPLLQELRICCCPSLTIIRDSEAIFNDISHGGARSRIVRFPSLTHLNISFCKDLKTIDDLLHLPAIEGISITGCGLLSLPANRLTSFPQLKHLGILMCECLWQNGMLLPSSLQNLTLSRCGDFSAWLPSCLEKLTSLESLQICNCECIVSVPSHLWSSNLKSVHRLKFHRCPKLKSIGGPYAIANIRDLFIDECPELKEIDQPLRRGSSL